MTDQDQAIDLILVEQIVNLIPTSSWDLVIEELVEKIVDNMPSDVLEKLTGDPVGFEKAEAILHSYYNQTDSHRTLIADAFRLLSAEHTCIYLDSLNFFGTNNGIYQEPTASLQQMPGGQNVNEGSEKEWIWNQTTEDV